METPCVIDTQPRPALSAEQQATLADLAAIVVDEFLAAVSHELRTPLNPILGWATLLQSDRLDPQKTAYAVQTIERSAKLQSQLIEDLLDISRISSGKLSLDEVSVNLATVISAACDTVCLAAQAKSIDLQVQKHLAKPVDPAELIAPVACLVAPFGSARNFHRSTSLG